MTKANRRFITPFFPLKAKLVVFLGKRHKPFCRLATLIIRDCTAPTSAMTCADCAVLGESVVGEKNGDPQDEGRYADDDGDGLLEIHRRLEAASF